MKGKKYPFLTIDALPIGFLCAVTVALALRRGIQVFREHGVAFRKHSASYKFELPEELMTTEINEQTEER